MIFTPDEAVLKIKENLKPPKWIVDARTYHKDWKALFYGMDFKDKLLRIENIESEKRAKPRKDYSRPIKDLNQKLIRPVDAIYSAVGGSKIYDLTDIEKTKLRNQIKNIRDGLTIEKFLETYWAKDLYIVDPSGILFCEYQKQDWFKPTYKSIDAIRNYECYGQKIKWIIFEPTQVQENNTVHYKWRFVDEQNDYTFIQLGDKFTLVEDESFIHPFGDVPALINSNITRLGFEGKLSPFDCIKEHQEETLRDLSVLTIYKFQKGMPKSWRPAILCDECHGTGKIEHKECGACNGAGELFKPDITDEIIIPISSTNDQLNIPASVGGFLSLDTETLNKLEEIPEKATMSMYDALWGITLESERQPNRTATEILINAQPKINKLNEWSDVAQYMEKQITEWLANWLFEGKDKTKSIAQIHYGRIYLIRTSKDILTDLETAIEKNLPDSVKSRLYSEYLTTKYKNDPESLMEELKKSELEYFPFYSIDDVNKIMGSDVAKRKLLFTDWWESLKESDKKQETSKLETLRDTWMEEQLQKITDTNIKNQEQFFNNNLNNNLNQNQNGNISLQTNTSGQGRGQF